jgi:hypothetical protein
MRTLTYMFPPAVLCLTKSIRCMQKSHIYATCMYCIMPVATVMLGNPRPKPAVVGWTGILKAAAKLRRRTRAELTLMLQSAGHVRTISNCAEHLTFELECTAVRT